VAAPLPSFLGAAGIRSDIDVQSALETVPILEVIVRFLIKASMPVERGNALVKNGTLGKTLESILADIKPEAAYFTELDGKRTALLIVELPNASQIPRIAEPFFLALNAAVEFHPVMLPEDLAKAGPDLEQAAKKYS
jgi:hypothetical protein